MARYNIVFVPWRDESTGEPFDIKVRFRYGDVWQYEYEMGDALLWGDNDIGAADIKYVVVDGELEGKPPYANFPEQFEVHIVNGRIFQVVPSTGKFDFDQAAEEFIVVEN